MHSVRWFRRSRAGQARTASIVAILAALAALNIAGVRGASRFNAVMTVAKLLPLSCSSSLAGRAVHGENLRWTATPARATSRARRPC